MESSTTLAVPRLRISRNSFNIDHDILRSSSNSILGRRDVDEQSDDAKDQDDDQESTPRMTSTINLLDASETPAARLRALLSHPSASPSTPMPRPTTSRSSLIDSDYEHPNSLYEGPSSTARENLKDIFSRALRDPGNTPQKDKVRPRRNSIDTSEVDASPRIQRATHKNGKNKRISWSDEDDDHAKSSEASIRSSQAATFDLLRERLMNSHSQLNDLRLSSSIFRDTSYSHEDDNPVRFLAGTNISTSTPPAATSTPQQSLRMSIDSRFPSQSNLLDQDSEMQRAFDGQDSFDVQATTQQPHPVPATKSSLSPERKKRSLEQSLLCTSRLAIHSVPATEPNSIIQLDTPRIEGSRQPHHPLRQRETDSPNSKTPTRPHSPKLARQSPQTLFPRSGSPTVNASTSKNAERRNSTLSDRSDGSASRRSPIVSHADYREKSGRGWNQPPASRPISSLGFHTPSPSQRTRTRSLIEETSTPPVDHRQPLQSSVGSSRASSPALSYTGSSHNEDDEIIHERERNWNSPHPKWTHSPYPPSKTDFLDHGQAEKSIQLPTHDMNNDRRRNTSTDTHPSRPLSRAISSPVSPRKDPTHSPLSHRNRPVTPTSPMSRNTIVDHKGKGRALDRSRPIEGFDESVSPDASLAISSSNSEQLPSQRFSFTKKRMTTDLGSERPANNSVSPGKDSTITSLGGSSKQTEKSSKIPVRSPKKLKPHRASTQSLSSQITVDNESHKLHASTLSVPHEHSPEDIPGRTFSAEISPQFDEELEHEVFVADNVSQTSTIEMASTIPVRTLDCKAEHSFSRQKMDDKSFSHHNGDALTRGSIKPTHASLIQELSPPPSPTQLSPRNLLGETRSLLATPPRRPSLTSRMEFRTPSPPRNMPDLPGPPTSSEEDTDDGSVAGSLLRADVTALKTPRPPGAWLATPALTRPHRSINVAIADYGGTTSNVSQTPTPASGAKSPRQPGIWSSTVAPPQQPSQVLSSDEHSSSTSSESGLQTGLVTPAPSFSKGTSMYMKTPAPPGAYFATPAARKSAMKVRFDPNGGASPEIATTDLLDDVATSSTDSTPRMTLRRLDTPRRTSSSQIVTPISPVSCRDGLQKRPGIRVLDAFGRELVKDEAGETSPNESDIHVVDAMRCEVGNGKPSISFEDDVSQPLAPVTREEALLRVRQGLADLVSDLDDMDKSEQDDYDSSRLRELQAVSTAARLARAQVSAAISNTEKISQKIKTSLPTVPRWQTRQLIYLFLIIQLCLVIVMYRISAAQARHLFLTTYYNPYFPDLHLYISNPDTLRLSIDDFSDTAWFTFPDTLDFRSWLSTSHRKVHQLIQGLRTRSRVHYGEDIPLKSPALVNWCIARLESWGTSAGMETFKDDGRQGSISVVLGGKVVVVDVDFAVQTTQIGKPSLSVSGVKTSYAITGPDGTLNSGGSAYLDAFIRASIQSFCDEVQKPEDLRDLEEATRLGLFVSEQLQYLVMLDKLAARTEDGGLQWFTGVEKLCLALEAFATTEADAVASSLSLPKAPMDIFLLRCHALPLPFLKSPSVSFLVYLSPQAYLSLQKRNKASLSPWDLSLQALRAHIDSIPSGIAMATLRLTVEHIGQIFPSTMNMPTFTARPTFPLSPQGSELEHSFPQIMDQSMTLGDLEVGKQYMWTLDFTNGGKHAGIVMSRSRMREIELIVNPLGGIDPLDSVTMSFGTTGSWVDLLLNPDAQVSPERYISLYTSPSSIHPPLQLKLTAPDEGGFRLEKVPIHNMKEVWGILEVVREQCWLNEILCGCQWYPEDLDRFMEEELPAETEATEAQLQAVLDGNLPPRKIPVNVFIPSQNMATDALFQTPDIDGIPMPHLPPRRPSIVMTSPERPPISGLVQITVSYDESRPRGVSVEISGAMGSDIQIDILEETCRRGATLGLAGRVWSKAV
ncbi:hypothetical protein H0H93_015993 [Arthromyces matolae]|nr:hypothetical protein H0H93_015993 [Arthromyces matolae]